MSQSLPPQPRHRRHSSPVMQDLFLVLLLSLALAFLLFVTLSPPAVGG